MKNQVIEIARIKLAVDVSEDELLAASDKFQTDFLSKQPGYLGRDLIRLGDGGYADIIRWERAEAAEAILTKLSASPACRDYFSIMEADGGIAFHTVLSSYGA